MLDTPPGSTSPPGWCDRVKYSAAGFAFRPNQLIVRADSSAGLEKVVTDVQLTVPDASLKYFKLLPAHVLLSGTFDVLEVMRTLRLRQARGELGPAFSVQPNHVMFAHGYRDALLTGDPFMGNSSMGNPYAVTQGAGVMAGLPPWVISWLEQPAAVASAYANPALPMNAVLPFAATGRGPNFARPAPAPGFSVGRSYDELRRPVVAVLDVALLDDVKPGGHLFEVQPGDSELLKYCERRQLPLGVDNPPDPGYWDQDRDGWPDRVAGHGMFIAGRIRQILTEGSLLVVQTMSNLGDVDEADVITRLGELVNQVDILNLSFGGYALDHMEALAQAVQEMQTRPCFSAVQAGADAQTLDESLGAVVVASAGNDATWAAPYPAVLPGVVSVGAIGPYGQAQFSNYGNWVRACASGVDVVSTFYDGVGTGEQPGPDGQPITFVGGAVGSGTSFSAPVVAGRLAELMHRDPSLLPKQAVARLIDAPGLPALPLLGTIVT